LKQREHRQKVMIRARMRSGVSWHDVCILNLSRRGLGIQAAEPPQRGAYVEIRRGKHVILARVMWTRGHRAGLHSQSLIFVRSLVRDEPANDGGHSATAYPAVDRRREPRAMRQRHERSRLAGRAMEFACIGLAASALGLTIVATIEQALARPIAQVRAALDGQATRP
jgi:hypothetical protein